MQKTINKTVRCVGIDIFGQQNTAITLEPADTGIVFVRDDLPGNPQIRCCCENVVVDSRWTALEQKGIRVEHIEHLLAVLAGLGIDNVTVRMTGPSIPVVDGYSCTDFVEALCTVGVTNLSVERQYFVVPHPCLVQDEFYLNGQRYEKFILALPADCLELIYLLDYPDRSLPSQAAQHIITPQEFINQLAGARSYITAEEYQQVARLIGRGMQSLLIFSAGKNQVLRWANEPARHKLVDLLGDLGTLGRPVKGRFIAFRSGHQLNITMVKKLTRWRM